MVTIKISIEDRKFRPVALIITVLLCIIALILLILTAGAIVTIVSLYDGMGSNAKEYYFFTVVEFIVHACWLLTAALTIVCLIVYASLACGAFSSRTRTILASFVMLNMFIFGLNVGAALFYFNRNEYILRLNKFTCNDNCEGLRAAYHVTMGSSLAMLIVTGLSSLFGALLFWS